MGIDVDKQRKRQINNYVSKDKGGRYCKPF